MMRYSIYRAEDFGFRGNPGDDESYAVFAEVGEGGKETGRGILTYIYNDDWEHPPRVDTDNAEGFVLEDGATDGLAPVFHCVGVGEDGELSIVSETGVVVLTEEQFRMLVSPACIQTDKGLCWLDDRERLPLYRPDESLDSIPARRLDMRKFNTAVARKWPALLGKTHAFCGKRYPEFPNLKYFEEKQKAVIFLTVDQIKYVSASAARGVTPLFRDFGLGRDWTTRNIYGICIVDNRKPDYEVRLISPDRLEKYREAAIRQERSAEKPSNAPIVSER